ncbi:hypothetical protein BTUL_0131g00020 [Botrytis tulipae]|uniref:Uncharacterized protein n=1 Tax=Botrytis tulipae TaxID=87230 RepID=A0A4Z1EJI6_9HELO|nr:hypothetical protein BTUL_0131g00020 [Botrytis tulipae]
MAKDSASKRKGLASRPKKDNFKASAKSKQAKTKTSAKSHRHKRVTSDSEEEVPRKKHKGSRRNDKKDDTNTEDEDEESSDLEGTLSDVDSSSSEEEEEDNKKDELRMPWWCMDQDLEDAIKLEWTPNDEHVLRDISNEEVSLWTKTLNFFSKAPRELLPDDKNIAMMMKEYGVGSSGQPIENTNWSNRLCIGLSHVICLPVFQKGYGGSPFFMRYCILMAMRYRLGKKLIEIPKLSNSQLGVHRNLFYKMEEELNISLSGSNKANLHQFLVLNNYSDLPRYYEFTYFIKRAVKNKNKSKDPVHAITNADMSAILDAWDLYVDKESPILLKHDEIWKLRRNNKGFRRFDKAEIQEIKRRWLVKSRLDARAELESQISGSESHDDSINLPAIPEASNANEQQNQDPIHKTKYDKRFTKPTPMVRGADFSRVPNSTISGQSMVPDEDAETDWTDGY